MKHVKGFAVIEIVVVAVILLLLISGAYIWVQSQNKEEVAQPDEQGSSIEVDVTKDWKTYASELDGARFSYPSEWKLSGGVMPNEDWPVEQVGLTSPMGLKIEFRVPIDGMGGACDVDSIECLVHVRKAEPFESLVKDKRLYVVQHWRLSAENRVYSMNVVDEDHRPESEEFTGLYYALFEAKMNHNAFGSSKKAIASFGLTKELPTEQMSVDEFYESDEMRTAELILRSLEY